MTDIEKREMVESHNKNFGEKSISSFNNLQMKIICVLGINEKDKVDVSMCGGLSREDMMKYLEGALKTLKYAK